MRRFFAGFLEGLFFGALLVWFYLKFARPGKKWLTQPPYTEETPTVPIRPPHRKEEARETVAPAPPLEENPPDDFAVLRGIGPVFAARLHESGIHTFAQLARLTPEEIAQRCDVPVWRVLRDDWIGQATAHAGQ